MSQFSGSSFGTYTRLWLFITGGILLATGAAMAIALGGIPFAGGITVVTGGTLAVVGVVLIVIGLVVGRRAAATSQLLPTGVSGQATITGLSQTGMYLNENPQIAMNLLVSLPGQAPYAAAHREIVPLMLLGRLNSGAPLAVRVDPADPSRVAIDWSATGFAPGAAQMMSGQPMMAATPPATPTSASAAGSGVDESLNQVQVALANSGARVAAPFANPEQGTMSIEQLRAHLRQDGVQGNARIDLLQDMGSVVGDERLYTIEMTLDPTGPSPRKLPASAAMVPLSVSHKLFQGMTVPVRYEASNANLLMVEWDRI